MEEQRYANIVQQYRGILAFISRYLVILSALAIGFFIFQRVFLNPTYISEREDPFFLKKVELIGKFENMLKQAQQGTDIQTYIIQGPLQTKNQTIISQDNLLSYKGIIVPRFFSLNIQQQSIQPLSYFSSPKYDTGELDRIISAFILNEYITLPPLIKNTQLPVDTSLSKTFNLSCVFTNKFSQSTCDYYIKNFLSSFFVFNLSLDYIELANIFSHLQENKQHLDTFCTNLQKYLLYTNDANEEIKLLFDQCGQETKDFFKKMENFINIQNQLEQWFINTDVYKDPTLNAYKLFSYQQILYHDMQENRVLYNQYIMYLTFIKELLKSPNKLDRFYYDEMYWFATHYLKPALQGTRYESRIWGIRDDQISTIIRLIDTINEGDDLWEFTGLLSQVSNKSILVLAPSYSWAQTDVPLQEKIIKKLKYISYLQVEPPTIRNNQATLSGVFILGEIKIATVLQVTYQDDTFYVRSMSIPEYPRLVSALKTLFTDKKVSLGDLYSAITKNFSFYQNNDSIQSWETKNICDDLNGRQKELSMTVTACSPDHITIRRTLSTVSWTQELLYTIFLTNYMPNAIVVSDKQLQENINKLVSLDSSRALSGLIQEIFDVPFRIAVIQTGNEGTANMISVLETFKKYLSIAPNDIAEKDSKLLVDFTIKDISFLGYYKANTHVLEPIYFKQVATSGQPLIIQWLGFTLNDSSRNILQSFITDPLTYIKNIDTTAWRNYITPASSTKQP